MGTYRPRGALARALFEKIHNDKYLEEILEDSAKWYSLTNFLPEQYQRHFVPLGEPDEITLQWLDKSKMLSANFWLQIWHLLAKLFLGLFMTQTDINGFLKRGSMFILSETQFQNLLTAGGFDPNRFCSGLNGESRVELLDIGAGDGEITSILAKSISQMGDRIQMNVFATETSWTMRNRLEKRQFTVAENLKDLSNIKLISCLNVLDRCIDPHALLTEMHRILAPDGRVIVALVLPYSHYVETNSSHLPLSPLLPHWPNASKLPFETEATIFFEQLELIGFKIEAWTKAPYLCEGDLRQSFYWLIDLVVVLSKS